MLSKAAVTQCNFKGMFRVFVLKQEKRNSTFLLAFYCSYLLFTSVSGQIDNFNACTTFCSHLSGKGSFSTQL